MQIDSVRKVLNVYRQGAILIPKPNENVTYHWLASGTLRWAPMNGSDRSWNDACDIRLPIR